MNSCLALKWVKQSKVIHGPAHVDATPISDSQPSTRHQLKLQDHGHPGHCVALLPLYLPLSFCCYQFILLGIGQNPLHQFPRSKFVTSWRISCNKSTTSPQHKWQVHNKSITGWHGQKSVASVVSCCFPKFHYNDVGTTSWQLPRLLWSYIEMCVMDFGFNRGIRVWTACIELLSDSDPARNRPHGHLI